MPAFVEDHLSVWRGHAGGFGRGVGQRLGDHVEDEPAVVVRWNGLFHLTVVAIVEALVVVQGVDQHAPVCVEEDATAFVWVTTSVCAGFHAEVELTPEVGRLRGDFVAHPNLAISVHVNRGFVARFGEDVDLVEGPSHLGQHLDACGVVQQHAVGRVELHDALTGRGLDPVVCTQARVFLAHHLAVNQGAGVRDGLRIFAPAGVGVHGGQVQFGAVHAAGAFLHAHPDVVEIQFGGVHRVVQLPAAVLQSEGVGDVAGVAKVFHHDDRATVFGELHDGLDFGGGVSVLGGEADQAVRVKLGQRKRVSLHACDDVGGVPGVVDVGQEEGAADQRTGFDPHGFQVFSEGGQIVPVVVVGGQLVDVGDVDESQQHAEEQRGEHGPERDLERQPSDLR